MKHYTSIEQSKKLLELGLNPESADMCYSYYGNSKYNPTIAYKGQQWFLCQIRNSLHDDIPCWSLGALLEVMPIIKKGIDEYLPYFIKGSEIWKGKIQSFWYCSYALLDDSNTELITFKNSTKIEAAYNMVVWLLENNYIKKEGNT